ncbi:MAG: RNA 2',3'-cyclic phosphodiesterase [Magnetococcales bacterium]|nr:RNA 2',3'-cyclic phosphodiesterase [Magnetococcales bacterium]
MDIQTVNNSRFFVGIVPPQPLKEAILQATKPYRQRLHGFRWLSAQTYHITPRFFGHLTADEAPVLVDQLNRIAALFQPFTLQLTQWGGFPNLRRPRVLWLGVGGKSASLLTNFAAEMGGISPTSDNHKPFYPHLSVARSRSPLPLCATKLSQAPVPDLPWQVEQFHLIRSTLDGQGTHYKTVATFSLGAPSTQEKGGD